MNSKGAFKKCRDDDFAICYLEAEKGWVGVEPEYYSYGLYQYMIKGSVKFGVPFKENYDIVKAKDFYCTKDKLYDAFIMEALEDFSIIGFNTLDKEQDWDGCIVTGNLIRVDKESILICLDGNPTVENEELKVFDYGVLDPHIDYNVDVTDGVLAIFTKN